MTEYAKKKARVFISNIKDKLLQIKDTNLL